MRDRAASSCGRCGRWIVAVAALAVLAPPGYAEEVSGKAVAVESGDTLVIVSAAGNLTVRLADIGAPQGGEYYAPSARTLLSNMVLGADVRVVVTGRAGADRIFGHVYAGELDVNLELVKRGAAWMCLEYTTTTDYLPFQNEAIRRRWGVWSRTTTFDTWVACRKRPPGEKAAVSANPDSRRP